MTAIGGTSAQGRARLCRFSTGDPEMTAHNMTKPLDRASFLPVFEPPVPEGGDPNAFPSPAAILVVDDNPAKRIAIRAMLAPLGERVIEVESGREALREVLRRT